MGNNRHYAEVIEPPISFLLSHLTFEPPTDNNHQLSNYIEGKQMASPLSHAQNIIDTSYMCAIVLQ